MPARSIKGRKATPHKPPPQKKGNNKKEVVMDSSSSEDDSSYESNDDNSSEYSTEEEEIIQTPPPNKSTTSKKKSLEKKKAESSSEEESDDSGSEEESDDSSEGSDGHESDKDDSDDDSDDDEEEETKGVVKKVGFTDSNASWLQPKKEKAQLMSSSDEEDDEFDGDSEDSSDDGGSDEDGDMLEIERQSRLLDEEMEIEEAEAEDEMRRTITENTAVFQLPTQEELEDEANRVMPPSELKERIDAILEVLAMFKERRQKARSRNDYITQLAADMSELFGYLPELVDYFLAMWGPSETLEFLSASDQPRPLVIRTNTLKVRRKDLAASLMKRGVNLDPLANWSKVGLKITDSPIPIGATPEYLSGHYILQSAASLCPVMALSPQPEERILDMSAAPGGKTTHIAQLMRNTGILIGNDLKPERQKATVANLHRLGVKNAITCAYDGRHLGKIWQNKFDKILLDAPCSGLGVISRDPSVKVQRTIKDVQRCSVLQKELLLSAIDALTHKKGGGIMVYSTCSIAVAENEEVVNYILGKRDVKLLSTGLDFGKPGFTRFQEKRFHPSLALTRRFYPHVHNMDGFYVAKIQKLSNKHLKEEGEVSKKEVEEEKETVASSDDEEEPKCKKDEVDWNARVQAQIAKQTKQTKKAERKETDDVAPNTSIRIEKKKQKTKKKRPASKNDTEDNRAKKSKVSQLSPNPTMKPKKKSTNAKMTKPRRKKME